MGFNSHTVKASRIDNKTQRHQDWLIWKSSQPCCREVYDVCLSHSSWPGLWRSGPPECPTHLSYITGEGRVEVEGRHRTKTKITESQGVTSSFTAMARRSPMQDTIFSSTLSNLDAKRTTSGEVLPKTRLILLLPEYFLAISCPSLMYATAVALSDCALPGRPWRHQCKRAKWIVQC